MLLLVNSFVFYSIGYSTLADMKTGENLLGLFTLANALVHFAVAFGLKKFTIADKALFHLVGGLVLVFITLAIPVELDGNWVTVLWAAEALLLFWIGRKQAIIFYEKLSFPLVVLAVISLVHDWVIGYTISSVNKELIILFNPYFLSSLLVIAALGAINWLNFKYASAVTGNRSLKINSFVLAGLLLVVTYFAFCLEIATYWHQQYLASALEGASPAELNPKPQKDASLLTFKYLWILIYSLFYITVINFLNIHLIKRKKAGLLALICSATAILVTLSTGLFYLGELREAYQQQSAVFERGLPYLYMRYFLFGFIVLLFYSAWLLIRQSFMQNNLRKLYFYGLHITLLSILSNELIHWLDLAGSSAEYKLGLTILWGVYALGLIVLGIWKKEKYLRIAAIILFAVTLVKLFFYDIAHLSTISKTIVFVALGVLLLIISFLYNKYKNIILTEEQK